MHTKVAVLVASAGLAAAGSCPLAADPALQLVANPVWAPDGTDPFTPTRGVPFTIQFDGRGLGPKVDIVLGKGPPTNVVPQGFILQEIDNCGLERCQVSWTPACSLEETAGANMGYGLRIIDNATCKYQWTVQFGLRKGTVCDSATSSSSSPIRSSSILIASSSVPVASSSIPVASSSVPVASSSSTRPVSSAIAAPSETAKTSEIIRSSVSSAPAPSSEPAKSSTSSKLSEMVKPSVSGDFKPSVSDDCQHSATGSSKPSATGDSKSAPTSNTPKPSLSGDSKPSLTGASNPSQASQLKPSYTVSCIEDDDEDDDDSHPTGLPVKSDYLVQPSAKSFPVNSGYPASPSASPVKASNNLPAQSYVYSPPMNNTSFGASNSSTGSLKPSYIPLQSNDATGRQLTSALAIVAAFAISFVLI